MVIRKIPLQSTSGSLVVGHSLIKRAVAISHAGGLAEINSWDSKRYRLLSDGNAFRGYIDVGHCNCMLKNGSDVEWI